MFFEILALTAEFEANLIGMRTREDMARAGAKGKLEGGTQTPRTPPGGPRKQQHPEP